MDNLERTPNWAPLEKAIPGGQRGAWMWMSSVPVDAGRIEQYKHCETRGCLNLDENGRAWFLRFRATSAADAPTIAEPIPMATAFAWALLDDQPASPSYQPWQRT